MKKIFAIILLTASMMGCQSDLLDTFPYDTAATENMWTTESLADQGVLGIYNALRYGTVASEPYYFEGLGVGGNLAWNYGWNGLLTNQISGSDGFFWNYWVQHYEMISRANDAITNLPKAPLTEEKMARLLSESKFFRAYAYYRLNAVYRGVPVYLEPTDVNEFTKGRETEEYVWKVVLDDLTDCINDVNLPGRYESNDTEYGRVTIGAALALRGKVYLWIKEYAKAEADFKAIAGLGYTLFQGGYGELFTEENERNPEIILSLQCLEEPGYGNLMSKWYGSRVAAGSCINELVPNTDFVETYQWKDGKSFNWDDLFPGYSQMTPDQRLVYFLRDNLTEDEFARMESAGADMSKYLPTGNEARLLKAYMDRDPRLMATIITPYSTFLGTDGLAAYIYTLRWPYRGYDASEPFDLRTNTNNFLYYLFRKFVGLGRDPYINRENSPIDLPIIRYADVLLNLAEALNEQGKTTEAITYVNMVRERAGVAELNSNSETQVVGAEDLRDRIRMERRWELNGEGITFYDELRWGVYKESKFFEGSGLKQIYGKSSQYTHAWNDRLLKWPIPNVEVERNSNLIQNPGWES